MLRNNNKARMIKEKEAKNNCLPVVKKMERKSLQSIHYLWVKNFKIKEKIKFKNRIEAKLQNKTKVGMIIWFQVLVKSLVQVQVVKERIKKDQVINIHGLTEMKGKPCKVKELVVNRIQIIKMTSIERATQTYDKI